MEISKVYAVYFSPAGSTGKLTEYIAAEAARLLAVPDAETKSDGTDSGYEVIDFTLPAAREKTYSFGPGDLVVFGTPTYAGRIPNKALPFVQELFSADRTPYIAVATFGNRNYDNVLNELVFEGKENGFIPLGAGAFPAKHVFSDMMAVGRPDAEDLKTADSFCAQVVGKIESAGSADELVPIELGEVGPYYTPLREDGERAVFLRAKPKTDPEKCVKCGICAKKCPMGSIDPEDVSNIPGVCIKCYSCVTRCPKGAKYFDDEQLISHIRVLEKKYGGVRSKVALFV